MLMGAVGRNVMSKTWLRGLSELVAALDDPDRYGDKYIKRFVGTAIPTGVAQIERAISPEMEVVQTELDAIRSRVPGFSDALPPRRNLWGEPIVLGGGLGPDIISPIYTSTTVSSPVDEEILRLRMPLSMPRQVQSFDGVALRLSPHEYDRLIVLMNEVKLPETGKNLQDTLKQVIRSKEYKRLDGPREKRDKLAKYINMALGSPRRQFGARYKLIMENADLRRDFEQRKAELIRAR
jgi:hypothetical protein